jgi:glucose-6-phosphate-specific signal transduction histidine kinase
MILMPDSDVLFDWSFRLAVCIAAQATHWAVLQIVDALIVYWVMTQC